MTEILGWMKDNLPAQYWLPVGVVLLIGYVLGYPAMKARRDAVVQRERASKADAESSAEASQSEVRRYRREDDATDVYEARWLRAMTEAEEERKGRLLALDAVQAARLDVHNAANASQLLIAAVEQRAKAEIERLSHAAEARITEAESRAGKRVRELQGQVDLLNEITDALTRQNQACEDANKRLEDANTKLGRKVDALEAWQTRSDMGGRD